MRAALILANLLMIVPAAAGQGSLPAPSIQLDLADVPEGTQVAGDHPFVFDVTVECTFPTADPMWRYRAFIAVDATPDVLVNLPAQRDFPAGLCLQMGRHTERFEGNITFLDQGRNETHLKLLVIVEPDNGMVQGWPPELMQQFAWPRADANGTQAKPQVLESPPPQETTPGPALAVILAAIVAFARRQR